jgi:lipopolysaccharide cholinephosphotransferase
MQQIQFDILLEVEKLCSLAGLKYFIDYGTLLGARRHGGFIPWDDDIDIAMAPRSIEVLRKAAPDALPSHLTVHPHITFPTAFKVADSRYYIEERTGLNRAGKSVSHPGIDIFPFGSYRKFSRYLPSRTIALISHKKPTAKTRARVLFGERNAKALAFWGISAAPSRLLRSYANFVECDAGLNWQEASPEGLLGHGLAAGPGTKNLAYAMIFPLQTIKFEGRIFLAPKDVDAYLTSFYGDWQTPVESPHHLLRAWQN